MGIASSKLSLKRTILLQDSNGYIPSGENYTIHVMLMFLLVPTKTAMLTVTFSASFLD